MERVKKILLVGASSLLLFCFPAFADELEASELPIEEVTHDIEIIHDSGLEASEISNDNLAQIMSGPLKSPSVDPNNDFRVLGYTLSNNGNAKKFDLLFQGTPRGTLGLYRQNSSGDTGYFDLDNSYSVSIQNFPYTVYYVYDYYDNTYHNVYNVNLTITADTEPSSNSGFQIGSYLNFVTIVFSWLLTTIGVLIGFILSNPFLAVSLLLFMAGTVISFYIRIKNS